MNVCGDYSEGTESQGRVRSRGAMCVFTDVLKGSLWRRGSRSSSRGTNWGAVTGSRWPKLGPDEEQWQQAPKA